MKPRYNTRHFELRIREVARVRRAALRRTDLSRPMPTRSPIRRRMAMNCDQVFMILTRGPFPTGEPWDEEVEGHLESCSECWRLAEALRPALAIFQEAVP